MYIRYDLVYNIPSAVSDCYDDYILVEILLNLVLEQLADFV
jgi:hypothetical protein